MSNASPFARYRSPEARVRDLAKLADTARAEVHVLGESVEGRAISAVHVRGARRDRALLVCAGIHGPEYIGVEVALGVLARARDSMSSLLDRADLWVVPTLNPDGYARTFERGGVGKLHELRRNARGVDLNRNFPLPGPLAPVLSTLDGWRTGSGDPENPFYRGAAPLSEPETAALETLLARVHFTASVSLHSTMGTLFPPCITSAASARTYRSLCDAFTSSQKLARYRHFLGGSLDRFTGEQEDHQHHAHRTWAICVEHYPVWVEPRRFFQPNLFRRFNPPDPEPWVASDVAGVAAYFRAALDLPPPDHEAAPS
ncbi:hypothetical protein BH09MYX1_BH09MYX1_18530 [soil metagenome]